MPIILFQHDFTIQPSGSILDSRNPSGTVSGIDTPLPSLAEYESNMVTYGHDTFTGAKERDPDFSYYYDYTWVCRQISQWRGGDAQFDEWERKALIAYTTDRFNQPNESYPYKLSGGFWNFPHGLYHHWLEGGPEAARAIEWLQGYVSQTSSSFNYPYPKGDGIESPGWPNKDSWAGQRVSREVAYWIQGHIYGERAGLPRKTYNGEPYLARYVNFAANHLRQWYTNDYQEPLYGSDTDGWLQVFMLFLTLYALTELVDYLREIGEDENQWWPYPNWTATNYDWPIVPWPTVSEAIVAMTYWIFDTATTKDGNNNRLWVADDGSGYGAFRYVDRSVSGVGSPNPAPDLNLLCVPVFGWVGREVNDPTMFTARGDHVFQGGVKNAYLVQAKGFNQNYIKSFDYITHRNNFGS